MCCTQATRHLNAFGMISNHLNFEYFLIILGSFMHCPLGWQLCGNVEARKVARSFIEYIVLWLWFVCYSIWIESILTTIIKCTLYVFISQKFCSVENKSYYYYHHYMPRCLYIPWWRHQMEIFSALLAICAGNSPVPGEFPAQRPVTRSFGVFFDLRLNQRLSKQSLGWWFDSIMRSLQCMAPGRGETCSGTNEVTPQYMRKQSAWI